MWIEILKCALCAVIGYALGNCTTGVFIAKFMGNIDIKKTGSGNAGTTNVLRTLGWKASVMTLVGDALKGLIAVIVGRWIGGTYGAYLGAIFAVLGHNWPALQHFKGGKGVATSFGAILALNPWVALIMLVWQIVIVALTRYMSVASISSAILFSVVVAIQKWGDWLQILFAMIISALAIFCHRENIARLIAHKENKLDFAKINAISKKK